MATLLITPLITTHEPPSNDGSSVAGYGAEAEAELGRHEESERLREEQRRGDLLGVT